MVLGVAIAILAVLEGEGPRAVCLVVTLGIDLVTIVSNGEEVLVGAALVALVVTTIELVIFGVELQQTAADNLIGIFDGLLQTTVGLRELRIGLSVSNGLHLGSRERIVTPNEIGTSKQGLSSLTRGHARIAVIVLQQRLGISQVSNNLIEHCVQVLTLSGRAALFCEYRYLAPQLCQFQIGQRTQELSLTHSCVIASLRDLTGFQRVVDGGDGLVVLSDTQQQMIEYLDLIPSGGFLLKTTVHRTSFALFTLEGNEFITVQFDDKRER